MAMQESPDKWLDDCIVQTLKHNTYVTAQQKQRAWEKLEQKVSAQAKLPPLPAPRPWSVRFTAAMHSALHGFISFLADESMYQRAHRLGLPFTEYYHMRKRFPFVDYCLHT